MRSFQGTNRSNTYIHEDPIREEIFSVERLEQFATELAGEHRVSLRPKSRRRLLPRLEENRRKLIAVYRTLAGAIRDGRTA
jgi:cyclic beta-1,2-glucan synthetase